MQTDKPLSTQKIVVFLLFICAALMTSVFIFHSQQTRKPTNLPADEGFIFPLSRDINHFNLVAADNTAFTQQNLLGHWTLLFFGFTHCTSLCPTTLSMLSQAYNQLHKTLPTLQIALISLDPERDSTTALHEYTQRFNPHFLGISGKLQELRQLQSQLGIFSAKDPATTNTDYQLQHSPSIILITPNGKWAGIFKYGLNAQQFTQAMTNAISLLKQPA